MSFECCVLLHVVASGATQGFVPDFLGAGSNFLSDVCLFLFFIISKVKAEFTQITLCIFMMGNAGAKKDTDAPTPVL